MSFDTKKLAELKSLESNSPAIEWLQVLETARHSLSVVSVHDEALKQLACASCSPEAFMIMVRLIYRAGKLDPAGGGGFSFALLCEYMNDSLFAWSEWIDAIEYFYRWLKKNERNINFLSMLGYLQCCSVSPDAQAGGQSLVALLQHMLEQYDYEAG